MSQPLLAMYTIAIILISTKFLGLLMRKLGLPQVLGSILAGILIGPTIWSTFVPQNDFFPLSSHVIESF